MIASGRVKMDEPNPGDVTVEDHTGDVVFVGVTAPQRLEFQAGTHADVSYDAGPPQTIEHISPYTT